YGVRRQSRNRLFIPCLQKARSRPTDEHSHSGDEILELVVSAMVAAVTRCPIDVRRHVASKVYFVGGRSRCVSLEADILEAFALLVCDKLPNFSSESITVFDTDPSMDPTDLIWIGASIYGGMPVPHPAMHKSTADDSMAVRVTDWLNTFQ
ncbi:hypothetical protein FOZ62_023873, partial [Perkinsus olseni]